MPSPNYTANGTVQPSRFVVIDTSTSSRVIQASASTSPLVGVSQEWSKLAPTPGQTSEAADAGDPIKVYSLGELCLLQSTTAGWTAGDRLTADASGDGKTTTTAGDYYGAIALDTVSGQVLGRVQVEFGRNP